VGVGDPAGLFERVGGLGFFEALVDRFYAGVVDDPVLAPMYPADDLDGARRRLALFLAQYWGGPTTYSEERGHPRLRMRHAPFPIDVAARDAWLGHMGASLTAGGLDPADEALVWDYLCAAAAHLQNLP
jgi:hemoglobin